MRLRVLTPLVTAILFVASSVAVAEEAPAKSVAGVLEATPFGVNGKPLGKNSVSLWQQTPADAANKRLWNDRKTGTSWMPVKGFATSGSSTFEKLEPGTYRMTVREGHEQTGAFGASSPIVIDSAHQSVATKVQLVPGGNLQFTCVDAESGKAIPPPNITLQSNDDSFWKSSQFRAEQVAGQPGHFEFRNLPVGAYRLHASRSASHPNDLKYELAGGNVDVQIESQQTASRELKFQKAKLTPEDVAEGWPFVVHGKVSDEKGNPVANAIVRAHTGIATMFQTGAAETDSDGHYRLNFAVGGIHRGDGLAPAIITASKPGMSESNLNQQGEIAVAYERSAEDAGWLAKRPLLLPKEPREINFTLSPAGTLAVRVYRENRDEADGISVSLMGHTMPPGCSVIDSGRTDKWGEITFAEVPLNKEWWIEIVRGVRSVRSQPFKLTQPQRYDLALDSRTDKAGIEVLDVRRLNDALGRDQTLALIGDEPLAHPPASAADQEQVRDWLRKIADRNRLWLAPPPKEVSSYHYDFYLADAPAHRYEVPDDRRVAGVVFHGIAYVSALSCLADNPDNVVARRIDRADGSVSIAYTLREPVSISAGNGVLNNYRGFFSMPVQGGVLVFDPKTMQVQQHTTNDVVEKYSDYTRAKDDLVVPRTVEIVDGSKMQFRWSFALYEPGLWLLDRSLAREPNDKDGFVRVDNIVINGAPPVRWRDAQE